MYMKAFLAPIFVQVLIALGSIVIQAIEVNSRHHHIPAHLASFHYKCHRYSHKNQIEGQYRRFRNYRPRSLCIRGGEFEYKEKSPTVKYSLYKSVAVFLTSIVGIASFLLAIEPENGVKALGFDQYYSIDIGSTVLLIEAIGTIIFGNLLSSYLIEKNITTCQKAVAAGFATRILKSFSIVNRLQNLTLKTGFIDFVRVIGSLAIALLIGGSEEVGNLGAYSLSILSGCVGFAMYLKPDMVANLIFGMDVGIYGQEVNRGLCKILGGTTFVSAVYMSLLTFLSCEPRKARAISSLVWIVMSIDFLFSKVYREIYDQIESRPFLLILILILNSFMIILPIKR